MRLTVVTAVLGLTACVAPRPKVHGDYDHRGGGIYFPITVRLHTTPDYATAVVDDIQRYGANSTLRLDPSVAHRIEIQKTGFYGQVLHLDPNPAYLRQDLTEETNDGTPVVRGPAFFAWLEDLATGERTKIDYDDVRVALEPLRTPAQHARLGERPDTIVAVMPTIAPRADEMDPTLFDAIGDQLRVGLGARRVPVIDRGRLRTQIEATIRDEKKNSYRACVDEACQIPLGKSLAATHLLRSTLARVKERCSLSIELIDLTSELTIDASAATTTCNGTGPLDAAEQLMERMFPSESR